MSLEIEIQDGIVAAKSQSRAPAPAIAKTQSRRTSLGFVPADALLGFPTPSETIIDRKTAQIQQIVTTRSVLAAPANFTTESRRHGAAIRELQIRNPGMNETRNGSEIIFSPFNAVSWFPSFLVSL